MSEGDFPAPESGFILNAGGGPTDDKPTFLTEPKDHGREIRAYIRDPDGHLIEVGQATGLLSAP